MGNCLRRSASTEEESNQRNIIVLPLSSCGYDGSFVANHILKKEKFDMRYSSGAGKAVIATDCEVIHRDKPYSFTVATVRGEFNKTSEMLQKIAYNMSRCAEGGVNCVVFVMPLSRRIPDDDIFNNISEEAQSIIMLIITGCADMSEEEKKDYAKKLKKQNKENVIPKARMIPVCFSGQDDFSVSMREKRIKRDEETLLNVICHNCKEMVPADNLLKAV